MRVFLLVSVQFVLFLVTFALGSFLLHPFHVQTVLSFTPSGTRLFVWDGVLLMLLLYGLVILLEAVTRRLRGRRAGRRWRWCWRGRRGWQ